MQTASFALPYTLDRFHQKALQWAKQFGEICFLNSNLRKDKWSKYNSILAVHAHRYFISSENKNTFSALEAFLNDVSEPFVPGFLSYELKNELEELNSNLPENTDFPQAFFFIPETVIWVDYENRITIRSAHPEKIYREIVDTEADHALTADKIIIRSRWTRTEYEKAFDRLQEHIHRGDLYEANLCQEFYGENVQIDPFAYYLELNKVSPTPFSSFLKFGDKFVLSASPERFLAKRAGRLISQPIKGTARRGNNEEEDRAMISRMLASEKEKAEHVMIVDLVRNDLTKSALPGTTKVDRLFDIQPFQQVHQMVSSITCVQSPRISNIQAIRHTFPAGSMTGAPKIAAMKVCEEIESTSRGLYAGSIGYFDLQHDEFDFNVVIRTLIYNQQKQYLSFHTGGAITNQAYAAQEYEECLLKATAMFHALGTSLTMANSSIPD